MTDEPIKNEIVREVFADLIDDPVSPMRTDIDRDGLHELALSIKKDGLINPITVRPVGERFEIVAGHRRFSACKIAGVIRIPCVVRDLNDTQTMSIRAVENLMREDIDPVDEALFLHEYMNKLNLSETDLANQIHRSVTYIKDRLAILRMPDYLIEYVKTAKIKLGHALALMEIDHDPTRHAWVELAVRDGVTVKQVEWWVHNYKIDKIRMQSSDDPNIAAGAVPPVASQRQQCLRCGGDDAMENLRLVWVHSVACPQPINETSH